MMTTGGPFHFKTEIPVFPNIFQLNKKSTQAKTTNDLFIKGNKKLKPIPNNKVRLLSISLVIAGQYSQWGWFNGMGCTKIRVDYMIKSCQLQVLTT